ncbi:sugar phosphate permease [Cryptosporidium canis]|uniref:Sugar phosphate permease n=1 Tax=Cryptosporidium canis TaxID=195482 RepID=A0A9D5HXN3_9CRYT|nr:sugar phosphate permease [Cryptosporidium canis]
MEELKLNSENENNYCEEEIDLCNNDELRLFDRCEYSEKYEDVEGSVYSSSTAFPSCDVSSKSSKNFTSIDNLCMLIGGGAGTTKSGGLGSGNECQKTEKLENVGIEDVLRPKGGLRCLRCDWLVGRVMEITMMKRLLPSMSKDEYNKFFLAYLSYMILYSTRKPFSVVKLQIQEDLSLSTSVLGWIDTTFLGSYAFGQLVIPTMFETVKANEYICVSFICSALASLVFGVSKSPLALLLCWFFNGLFHAGVYPMLVKYLIACFGVNERGRILGVWTTSQQVGAMVSTAFSASICLKLGWRSVFYIPSIFVFLFGLVVFKYLKRPRNLYIYDNFANRELGEENSMVLVMMEDPGSFKTVNGETEANKEFDSVDAERAASAVDKANGEGGGDRQNGLEVLARVEEENDAARYRGMAELRGKSPWISPSRADLKDAVAVSVEELGHDDCEMQLMSANPRSNGGSSSQLLVQKSVMTDPEKENDSSTKLRIEGRESSGDGIYVDKSEFGDHSGYVSELSPTKKNRRLGGKDRLGGAGMRELDAEASGVGEANTGGGNGCYSSFYIQNMDDVGFAKKVLILWRIPNIINIAISYYFIKLIRYSMLFWLPYYLIRELNYGPSIAGYSSMLFDIGGIIGAISAGAIADTYFGGRRILVACYMATLVSLSIVYFVMITRTELNSLILFGIAFMGFCVSGPDSILGSTAAQDIFDKSGISIKSIDSMATGIVNGMGAFGAVTQGTLTAYISEYYGWSALFLCLSVFSTLSFLILIPASYTKNQKSVV